MTFNQNKAKKLRNKYAVLWERAEGWERELKGKLASATCGMVRPMPSSFLMYAAS